MSAKWVANIARNFARDQTIREKYDVVEGSSNFEAKAGYEENVVGFGWTNASALQFSYELGWANAKAAANNGLKRKMRRSSAAFLSCEANYFAVFATSPM